MYNYTIHYTRKNGTSDKATFTEPSEREARRSFKECYRHGGPYIITEIEITVPGETVAKQLDNIAIMDNIDPAQREVLTYASQVIRFLEEQLATRKELQ